MWTVGGSIRPQVAGWSHYSRDGGISWSARVDADFGFPLRRILFLNESLGFAFGGCYQTGVGGIWASVDGGISWQLEISTGQEMKAMDVFIDATGLATLVTAGSSQQRGGDVYQAQVCLNQAGGCNIKTDIATLA